MNFRETLRWLLQGAPESALRERARQRHASMDAFVRLLHTNGYSDKSNATGADKARPSQNASEIENVGR